MKKMKSLWALLPVAVALIVASCSSEDAAELVSGKKTIPVTITVGMDNATRATVGDDNSSLYFQTGDKLAVLYSGAQIALLNNTTIAEGSSSATFQGNMTVPDAAESYGEVTVVLIGQNNVGVQANYSWSGSAICVASGSSTALNEAVKKYSYLKGTGPFNPAGQNNFTLTQHTAFLNFYVTFEDETAANTALSVAVTNNNSTIGSGSVTTTTDGENVFTNFVVPVAAGTVMNGATIEFTDKDPITLNTTATLAGKSYRIEKTIAGPDDPDDDDDDDDDDNPANSDKAPANVGAVQLWAGGPYWATMNIGANSPGDAGLYFAWGETEGYTLAQGTTNGEHDFCMSYRDDNDDDVLCYKWASAWDEFSKYVTNTIGYYGSEDGKHKLDPADDAATANWGSAWRMPTADDLSTLTNADGSGRVSCTYGPGGCTFTGTQQGYTTHSIFVPLSGFIEWGGHYYTNTGYIMSSELSPTINEGEWFDTMQLSAWADKDGAGLCDGPSNSFETFGRANGVPVRPVRDTPRNN